ncbi:MAG TPA: hypothetical protein VGP82_15725 [Ktedonobacterales bacterium]|jgi:hypothetical protein|nr:hypothetical protein [Ktedonobacterales bacterium]
MSQKACQEQSQPFQILSLILHAEDRLALIVHGSERWQATSGYSLLPMEFPSAPLEPGETPSAAAAALGMRALGGLIRIVSSKTVYGPSAARRIDRLGLLPDEDPVPLLRIERMTPEEHGDDIVLRPVLLRAYLAATTGGVKPGPEFSGLLWLPPDVLRIAVRGLPFEELLAYKGVRWQASARSPFPENAFVYVPAEYGERFLLRALAKYGPHAVLQGENNGVGF